MIIFAGINGYLDDMPAEWVRPFEKEFLPWVKERYPEIVHEIEMTKDFSAETEQKMHKAVQEFKERFVATRKEAEMATVA
jgi:F-type H+-transporting ATPase subunit alpha